MLQTITKPQTKEELLEHPEIFRGWLEGHDSGEQVGIGASTRDCPLACWLSADLGEPTAYAYDHQNDPWHTRFAQRIDRGGFSHTNTLRGRVSASEALDVLDEVLEG